MLCKKTTDHTNHNNHPSRMYFKEIKMRISINFKNHNIQNERITAIKYMSGG